MAFMNIAGRAGFLLELDKRQLDRGLPQAEQQFDRATAGMAASATRASSAIGDARAGMGLVGRIGLIGIGALATAQNLNTLAQEIDVTGARANTAEGRMRNFASALLQGDLVGGIKAVSGGAEAFEELGIQAKDAQAALVPLERLADTMGGKWRKIYDEARLVAETYGEIAKQTQAILNASLGFRDPSGQQILPGAVTGRPGPGGQIGPFTFGIPAPGAPEPPPPRSLPSQINERLQRARRGEDLQAELAAARDLEQFAQRRLEIVKREGPLMEKRRQELEDARNARDAVEDRIAADERADADRRDAAAKARADEQARALRERLQAREQNLRNAYAAALQTPGRRDDATRFGALRAFLFGESRDPRLTAGERADFRGELIDLRGQRSKDIQELRDAELAETRDEIAAQEQVLKNRVAAAELTKKNKRDDLKALRELRDFYKKHQRDREDVFSPLEQGRFGADRLETQKRINDLLSGKPDKEAAMDLGPFLRDFLASFIEWQNRSNVSGGSLQMHVTESLLREQTGVIKEGLLGPRRGLRMADEAVFA
jgi:hypothetical protein